MSEQKELLEKANNLPQGPGCYLMKDKNSRVIYVGKAKRLKSRVVSYFNQSSKSLKTEYMVGHVQDFDFILTHSDAESFILENNLIKEYTPKYNIRLRDDKSYPYIQVNWNEDFPRMEYIRRPKKAKNKELFGPFPHGSNISMILRVLTKSFSLRDCSLTEFKTRKTPCLLYQMKQCSAPCVKLISKEQYEQDIKTALGLFQGKIKANRTLNILKDRMLMLAENEEYEHAAIIRDHHGMLDEFFKESSSQQVESVGTDKNLDIWAFYEGPEEIDFSVYMIRAGLLLGQKNFSFVKGELIEEMDEEIIQKIWQYYEDSEDLIPDTLIIDREAEEPLETLSTALKIKVRGRTKKYMPLIMMCRKHAEESQKVRVANEDSVYVGLNKLKELLNIKERPRVLECYDIAIWQGQSPAASQIVFEEGKPDKTRYRYYHMQTRPEGNNDFAMMEEVFTRRIAHGKLPDVFVVDGGVAQVNTVVAVLRANNIDTCVVGIAKARDLTRGDFKSREVDRSEERLVIPGRINPYILNKCPSLFKIIVSMRDEAHRFSRKLHHKAEHKRVLGTWLDEIEGLGEESKKKILSQLTMTKDELKVMSVNDFINLFGIKAPQAKALWGHLQEDDSEAYTN